MTVMNPYNYGRPKNQIRMNIPETEKPAVKTATNQTNAYSKSSSQYIESKIMAAKPEELTYFLYEGLVKFIKLAMIQLDKQNYQEVNYNAQRAQAILDELRGTLNMEVEMSKSLDSLYEYMGFKLLKANVDKSEQFFKEALEIAESFKETWKQAFNIS